jgi:hypothetical protein
VPKFGLASRENSVGLRRTQLATNPASISINKKFCTFVEGFSLHANT